MDTFSHDHTSRTFGARLVAAATLVLLLGACSSTSTDSTTNPPAPVAAGGLVVLSVLVLLQAPSRRTSVAAATRRAPKVREVWSCEKVSIGDLQSVVFLLIRAGRRVGSLRRRGSLWCHAFRSISRRQHLETSQRLPTLLGMVDDRCGVAMWWSAIEGPGFVDRRRVHMAKLGHVPADVVAMRVEPPALDGGVEDPEVWRRVRAAAGRPLPSVLVGGEVGVDQPGHEVPGTVAPLDVQILDQEAGCNHSDPVVHPALGP